MNFKTVLVFTITVHPRQDHKAQHQTLQLFSYLTNENRKKMKMNHSFGQKNGADVYYVLKYDGI